MLQSVALTEAKCQAPITKRLLQCFLLHLNGHPNEGLDFLTKQQQLKNVILWDALMV